MILLQPHEVCPLGHLCEFVNEFIVVHGFSKCQGLNPDRKIEFKCDIWHKNKFVQRSKNDYERRADSR